MCAMSGSLPKRYNAIELQMAGVIFDIRNCYKGFVSSFYFNVDKKLITSRISFLVSSKFIGGIDD